jgi:hypothetical protein
MALPHRNRGSRSGPYYEIDEESDPARYDKSVTIALPKDRDWKRDTDGSVVTPLRKIILKPDVIIKKEIRLKKAA